MTHCKSLEGLIQKKNILQIHQYKTVQYHNGALQILRRVSLYNLKGLPRNIERILE